MQEHAPLQLGFLFLVGFFFFLKEFRAEKALFGLSA